MQIEFSRRHLLLFIVLLFANSVSLWFLRLRIEMSAHLPVAVWLMLFPGVVGSAFLSSVVIFRLVDVFRGKR